MKRSLAIKLLFFIFLAAVSVPDTKSCLASQPLSEAQVYEMMNEAKLELRKEIFNLNKKIAEAQATIKRREDEIRRLALERDQFQSQVRNTSGVVNSDLSNSKELQKLNEKVQSLNYTIAASVDLMREKDDQLANLNQRYQVLSNQLKTNTADNSQLKEKLSQVSTQATHEQTKLKAQTSDALLALKKENDDLRAQLNSAETDIDQKASTIRWLDDNNKILKEELVKKEEKVQNIRTLESQLKKQAALIQSKEEAITKLHAIKNEIIQKYADTLKTNAEYKKEIARLDKNLTEREYQYKQLTVERDALASELTVVRELKGVLTDKVAELNTKLDETERQMEEAKLPFVQQLSMLSQQLEEAKASIKILKEEKDNLTVKLKKVEEAAVPANEMQEKIVTETKAPLEASIQFLQKKLLATEDSIKTREEAIEKLSQDNERKEAKLAALQNQNSQLEDRLNKIRSNFEELQRQLPDQLAQATVASQDELNALKLQFEEKNAQYLEILAERDSLQEAVERLTRKIDELRSQILAQSSVDFKQSELRKDKNYSP